jgi:hypothetical protein
MHAQHGELIFHFIIFNVFYIMLACESLGKPSVLLELIINLFYFWLSPFFMNI